MTLGNTQVSEDFAVEVQPEFCWFEYNTVVSLSVCSHGSVTMCDIGGKA